MEAVAPVIARDRYDAFAAILVADQGFPATYGAWLDHSASEHERHIALGKRVVAVEVRPEEFADYCRRCCVEASMLTLTAFTVFKRLSRGLQTNL